MGQHVGAVTLPHELLYPAPVLLDGLILLRDTDVFFDDILILTVVIVCAVIVIFIFIVVVISFFVVLTDDGFLPRRLIILIYFTDLIVVVDIERVLPIVSTLVLLVDADVQMHVAVCMLLVSPLSTPRMLLACGVLSLILLSSQEHFLLAENII